MSEESTDDEGPWELLVDELCQRRRYFVGLFAFAVAFLIVQLPYLFVVDSGSALYVIATLNVVGSAVFAVGFGSVLWVCKSR